VRLQFLEAQGSTDIDKAHSEMTSVRAGALTDLWGNMFFGERIRLVDLAARNRLPALYPLQEFVDTGGLIAYGGNPADLIRRAASYVNKILASAKLGSLVEQPTNLELLINVKTAKAHGLEAPPSPLARADEVIE